MTIKNSVITCKSKKNKTMRIRNPRLTKGFKSLGKSKAVEIFGVAELIRNATPNFKPRKKFGIPFHLIKKRNPKKLEFIKHALEIKQDLKPQVKPELIKVAPTRVETKQFVKPVFEPRRRPTVKVPHSLLELVEEEAK